MQGYHKSVFLNEVIEALRVKKDKWYLDCTLGDGGHSSEILRLGGKVTGIDADPEALERTQKRLGNSGNSENSGLVLIQGNFRDIKNLINAQTETEHQKFAGAIFDLGVSSMQLETPQRGFSFMKEGPLDMRMDPGLGVTALDLLKVLSRKELYELFQNLGEEKHSWRLADALVRAGEIKTTKDLADVVVRVVGGVRGVRGKIHPATKVFQALRMAVNDELGALQEGLENVLGLMEKDGRIAVISFHSLEDRIVKNILKRWQLEGIGEILTKKPIEPSEEEIRANPRSRSAKLRIFEKL